MLSLGGVDALAGNVASQALQCSCNRRAMAKVKNFATFFLLHFTLLFR